MARVFHGCMNKNNDGTNRVIEKNFICFWPTSRPFWKRVGDVDFRVRTRCQELSKKKSSCKTLKDIGARGREDVRVIYLKKNNYVVK